MFVWCFLRHACITSVYSSHTDPYSGKKHKPKRIELGSGRTWVMGPPTLLHNLRASARWSWCRCGSWAAGSWLTVPKGSIFNVEFKKDECWSGLKKIQIKFNIAPGNPCQIFCCTPPGSQRSHWSGKRIRRAWRPSRFYIKPNPWKTSVLNKSEPRTKCRSEVHPPPRVLSQSSSHRVFGSKT